MTRTYPQPIAQNHSIFFCVPFVARITGIFRSKFSTFRSATREALLAAVDFRNHGKLREMVFFFHAIHRC